MVTNQLNALIEKHDEVLSRHYKLWFSDTSMLTKILNSKLEFRSAAFVEEEFKKRLRVYVQTQIFDKSREALKQNKFIVITGEPGVGKTTLAEMLVYEYLIEDYKLYYILDIREAEDILTDDKEKKVIYYDDFLGSNRAEINKAKGRETVLRKVLRRVAGMTNVLMVFTTRSFLLNTAISESENLRRFNVKAKESIFNLSEYNLPIKEQLLNNHIGESILSEELKTILGKADVRKFILTHRNFNPRSVEFITSNDAITGFSPERFEKFIYANFNDPIEIWEHAYTEQILRNDQLLLNTLISFGETTSMHNLERAFNFRLDYEVKNNNWTKEPFAFIKVMKRMAEGFLLLKGDSVYFINPSLTDFLIKYLRKDNDEVKRIVKSTCYATQLTRRLFALATVGSAAIPGELQQRLLKDYSSFIDEEFYDRDLIRLAMVILKYVDSDIKEEIVGKILADVEDWSALNDDYELNSHFKEFVDALRKKPLLFSIINENMSEILTEMLYGEDDINSAIIVVENFVSEYGITVDSLNTEEAKLRLESMFNDFIDQEIDWLRDFATDEGEAQSKRQELKILEQRFIKVGFELDTNIADFDVIDWFEVAMHNEYKRLMEKDD